MGISVALDASGIILVYTRPPRFSRPNTGTFPAAPTAAGAIVLATSTNGRSAERPRCHFTDRAGLAVCHLCRHTGADDGTRHRAAGFKRRAA
ncbi:MAG: hypothetical protein ACOYNL_06995 [Rickettsiales bacterium]